MAVAFYMDHHIQRAVTIGLRLRNVDVLTALEDGASRYEDAQLLDRSTQLNRVLFTQDDDLIVEAVHRQKNVIPFGGVIYAHQLRISIGKCIESLELIASVGTEEDMRNTIIFLPL